ncbi:MAG: RNase adapter RapZ [Deltaproteobacteria bacterium]|nr:RNase adapter RapZ [Deltaproteobacteria bacterium]
MAKGLSVPKKARALPSDQQQLRTLIITGISGAGKTTALHAVEDLGFHCVDNLPLPLLPAFFETLDAEPEVARAAMVVDARLKPHIGGFAQAYEEQLAEGRRLEVLYLDARDDVLIRRFSQTRRRHPLAGTDLRAGLMAERRILEPLRAHALTCLDTSEMTVHQLKRHIQERYEGEGEGMVISLVSFGFRYGVPAEADLIFDVRFLPNPYFVEGLRPLTGLDPRVSDYVFEQPDAPEFASRTHDYLEFLLPRYRAEGKVYLTVAIGCTGGRHRSVAMVEELGQALSDGRVVHKRHRDHVRG